MKPLVSICMITYNHEQFIAQAIEGVLMQQRSFSIEIVIGEDCSTDNTRNICLEYKEKYPDIIKLLLPERNLGVMPNLLQTLRACSGTYIAMLEGDDYWTSFQKLQTQIDILEHNPGYAVCFHNMEVQNEDDKSSHLSNQNQKEITTIAHLCRRNYIYTASCVFRNFHDYPEWLVKAMPGDWPLFIMAARYGDIFFIDEPLGVYRVHKGGTWNPRKRHLFNKKYFRTVHLVNKALGYKYASILQKHMWSIQKEILVLTLKDHKVKDFKRYIRLFTKNTPFSLYFTRFFIKLSIKVCLLFLYHRLFKKI